MKKNTIKILAIVLTAIMLFSVMGIAAMADNDTGGNEEGVPPESNYMGEPSGNEGEEGGDVGGATVYTVTVERTFFDKLGGIVAPNLPSFFNVQDTDNDGVISFPLPQTCEYEGKTIRLLIGISKPDSMR